MTIKDCTELQQRAVSSESIIPIGEATVICLLAEICKELKIFNQTIE